MTDIPTRAEVEAVADEIERKSLSEYAAMAVPMLRAYATTLPPQAAPVAEGKPTPEMRETARKIAIDVLDNWWNSFRDDEEVNGSNIEDLAVTLTEAYAAALAAEAQKAALEAEARCVEMREACEAASLRGISHPSDRDTIKANIRAIPLPTGGRFIALLEAMERIRVDCETSPKRYSDADCRQRCAIIAHEALAAFPQ